METRPANPWLVRARLVSQDFGRDLSMILTESAGGHDETRVRYARVEWVEHNPTQFLPQDAAVVMSQLAGQSMIDQLWALGYRPTDAKAGDATIAAMKEHIADLRRTAVDNGTLMNDVVRGVLLPKKEQP